MKQGKVVTAAKRGDAQATATRRMKTLDFAAIGGGGGGDDEEAEAERRTAARWRRRRRARRRRGGRRRFDDDEEAMEEAIASAAGLDPAQREDAKICASLFKGLCFLAARRPRRDGVYHPRVRRRSAEGEGSPYDERDEGVTHHVCDRPLEKDQMSRSAVRAAAVGRGLRQLARFDSDGGIRAGRAAAPPVAFSWTPTTRGTRRTASGPDGCARRPKPRARDPRSRRPTRTRPRACSPPRRRRRGGARVRPRPREEGSRRALPRAAAAAAAKRGRPTKKRRRGGRRDRGERRRLG